MFGNREGPETIPAHQVTVPEKTVCWGCKYYDEEMVKSGGLIGTPEYRPVCTHLEAHEDERLKVLGARRLDPTGFPDEVYTPDWCPFVREQKEMSDG